MGSGIDMARPDAPLHTALLDNFKDQLFIVMLNRLGGQVSIPVEAVDDTGGFVVVMSVNDRVFNFRVEKKQ
jgi:hypothetical protein